MQKLPILPNHFHGSQVATAVASPKMTCQHKTVILDSSPWAEAAGFERQGEQRRLAATTTSGQNPIISSSQSQKEAEQELRAISTKLASAFPAPLVLPFDELNWDPNYAPQSVRSWFLEPHRNKPTQARNVLYVAAVPEITSEVSFMKAWMTPQVDGDPPMTDSNVPAPAPEKLRPPGTEEFITYLQAFYHGLEVKALPHPLSWSTWTAARPPPRPRAGSSYVGLAAGEDGRTTRIRTRQPAPDATFAAQLNLADVLDAAIEMLPRDAYALVVLVEHDLYEDDEDDFCCGRAYGGSRVCVVSSARYHPALDAGGGIDAEHVWPASHCGRYVEGLCRGQDASMRVARAGERRKKGDAVGPLRMAVSAASKVRAGLSARDLEGLWFSRLARTVAHELGHCLGMDHCVYYACMMQGTSGMAEDVRQPPYLCPVCLAKVTHAVSRELGKADEKAKTVYVRERYEALERVCERWKHVGMFAGYGAWLRGRLESLE